MIGMKDEENEIMQSLLDTIKINDDNQVVYTEDEKQKIMQLAEAWKDCGIVKQYLGKEPEWMKKETAENLWIHMILKIVNAPTTLHMEAAIKMLIPVIARKLKEVDANGEAGTASDG